MLSCLPYQKVPLTKYKSIDPTSIEEYVIDFKHKNNTISTFKTAKHLKVEIKNAFLSSNFIDYYAIASLHSLDLDDKSQDKRYFSHQKINLELWS